MKRCAFWRCRVSVLLLGAFIVVGCRGRDAMVPEPAPVPFSPPAVAAEPVRPAVVPRFVDVARESGIDFLPFNDAAAGRWLMVEVLGSGAGWIDADLDGWLDLYLTDGCRFDAWVIGDGEHRDRLYRGVGGGAFRDVSMSAGIVDDHFGQGVAVGDYDADGFPDIYLSNFGPAALFHNNGDGTFNDVTAAAGIDVVTWGTSAAFADLDRDGTLDIYACGYVDNTPDNDHPCQAPSGERTFCGPAAYDGVPDSVWRGRGDGTFVEASRTLGIVEESGRGKGLGVAIVDFDGDLIPEVYVCNDAQPNYLLVANTDGDDSIRYEDRAMAAGCAVAGDGRGEASMGVVCDDFDGDGRPDIYLTHFYLWKNTLYRNLGQLLFADASEETGIAKITHELLGFGTIPLDWDRDGRLEMFATNGHVFGSSFFPYEMPPQLLWQTDHGSFIDVSTEVGGDYFHGGWVGRAAAGADYDNDGDLDVAVTHVGAPVGLIRNDTSAPGRFLGLDLGTASRVPPIGGRVEVRCGDRRIVRPIVAGGSYLAASDPRVLVTLPAGDEPADVTIHWPSGRSDAHRLRGDTHWRVIEGQDPWVVHRPPPIRRPDHPGEKPSPGRQE